MTELEKVSRNTTAQREKAWKAVRNAATQDYLGGLSNQHGIRVGGTADHVHMLAIFGRETTQADWVRDLQRASSIWVKERFNGQGLDDFEWQSGYGNFAVCFDRVATVIRYIEGQEEHHRKVDFQDEYRAMLTKLGIKWDERYVWD